MQKIKGLITKYKELILYIVFGLGTTVVNWGSYTVLFKFVIENVAVVNAFSWVCATLFAYITNKIWVFESKSSSVHALLKEFLMFIAARLGTGALEMVLVPLLVALGFDQGLANIRGLYAKVGVSILVVFLNYFISKLVIFRKEKDRFF